jgi:hypothetical protein
MRQRFRGAADNLAMLLHLALRLSLLQCDRLLAELAWLIESGDYEVRAQA